jgi:hypothetical protein
VIIGNIGIFHFNFCIKIVQNQSHKHCSSIVIEVSVELYLWIFENKGILMDKDLFFECFEHVMYDDYEISKRLY